ncbi:hypothetical protein [Nocardia sp. NPDC058666]|uniref:hypothetical protein n=1 Tax=Nocardia sp. NPDC058666 TaxID=3346587 RepID=UPI00364E20C1
MSKRRARAELIRCLHRTRLEPYLEEAGRDERSALALYQWNLQLTAAFQEVLSVTEVLLRNAIDCQLQKWNDNELGSSGSWLLTAPAAPLRSLTNSKRASAKDQADKAAARWDAKHRRYGHVVTHDDVLAQVTFGAWKDLLPNHVPNAGDTTSNANRVRMWNEALIHAFPHVTDPDGMTTFWRVYRLHGLRNRVSHMESLLTCEIADRARDVFDLAGSISPAARNWLTGISRVSAVAKTRPMPTKLGALVGPIS